MNETEVKIIVMENNEREIRLKHSIETRDALKNSLDKCADVHRRMENGTLLESSL